MINKSCKLTVSDDFVASVNESGSEITIEERWNFKDGDFVYTELSSGGKFISIFKNFNNTQTNTYCDLSLRDNYLYNNNIRCYLCDKSSLLLMRIATKEETKILLEKLKEKNLVWDKETFTLEEIFMPKRGDLCIFYDNDEYYASIDIFVEYNEDDDYPFKTQNNHWMHVIPFDLKKYKEMINFKE